MCIPYLRWKRPDLERPIRVNLFFPIIYIIATIFITVVPCIASPVDTGKLQYLRKFIHVIYSLFGFFFSYQIGYGALIIFTGVPVYFVFIYWKNKPQCIRRFLCKFHIVLVCSLTVCIIIFFLRCFFFSLI